MGPDEPEDGLYHSTCPYCGQHVTLAVGDTVWRAARTGAAVCPVDVRGGDGNHAAFNNESLP